MIRFVSLLILCVLSSATEYVVKIEGQEHFDEFLESNDVTMIEFYAPWCGHCKKLLPEFEKAAEDLAEDEIKLAKVDCTAEGNEDVCGKFNVKGYPTIKFFQNKKASDYEGGRTADPIKNFVISRSGPAVTPLTEEELAKKFVEDNSISVVQFAEEMDTSFEKHASNLRDDNAFAFISLPALATALGGKMGSIMMFRNFDEPKLEFNGKLDETDEFAKWVADASFPLVGEIGPENYKKYMDRGLPLMWIAVDPKEETPEVVEAARKIAPDYKNDISIVRLDGVKFESHIKNLGGDGSLPSVIISHENKKYVFAGENVADTDVLKKWVGQWKEGTLEPFMKSADAPEDPYADGKVAVLVGKTFDELVVNNDKDVLVEFYAPWCGHCKKLEPEYLDAANRLAEHENVVLAKMDSTENDGPVEVTGFPTLYFFSSEDKTKPQKYTGGRTADEIEKWMLENAPHLKDTEAAKAAKDAEEPEKEAEGHEDL